MANANAKIVPASEVEYILWGDEYCQVEDFLQRLQEHICIGITLPEDLETHYLVAARAPLRISYKDCVADFTSDWDDEFEEWSYPPEWEGQQEFQQAIDIFAKAVKQFEAANNRFYTVVCDHAKSVSLYDLVMCHQSIEDVR